MYAVSPPMRSGGPCPSIDNFCLDNRRALAMSITIFIGLMGLFVSFFSLGYKIGKDVNDKKQK